jgi:hypothetical protein
MCPCRGAQKRLVSPEGTLVQFPQSVTSRGIPFRDPDQGGGVTGRLADARAQGSAGPLAREPGLSADHARTGTDTRPNQRIPNNVSAKPAKAPALTRARATSPARSTHATPVHVSAPAPRRDRLQSPLAMKHVAPSRPVLVAPARSMPPTAKEIRKPASPPARPPVVPADFTEAGVLLAITYSIRDGRRNEFFDLMRELKPLLTGIGGIDCTIYEDRSRPNYFMEVFRFKDEAEFTAFDDKFHKDRKIAAIYALLDDIVEAEKSDFKIFERRL